MVMVADNELPNSPAQELLPALQELNPPPAAQQEPEAGQVEEHAEKNVEEPLHPCVICLEEEANQAAAFCNHIATCKNCTSQLMDISRNNCLICHSVVIFYLKVFFS